MLGREDGGLNRVYLAIISRYKDYIEERESISVAELPRLVTPKDERVAKKVSEIEAGYPIYSYDDDFDNASMKAFEYVRDGIDGVSLPLQFWLLPGDVLAFGVGDSIDKAILLCSLLVGLGDPSAKVLVSMHGGDTYVSVYYERSGRVRAFGSDGQAHDYASKKELYAAAGIADADAAYEFNNQTYSDIY